jgi:hypothetical protein
MKKGTRFILGATIALLTAVSLHYSSEHRFRDGDFRQFAHYGCGGSWERYERHHDGPHTKHAPEATPQQTSNSN